MKIQAAFAQSTTGCQPVEKMRKKTQQRQALMKIEQALIQSDKVCSIFIRGCVSMNHGRLTDYKETK